MRPRKSLTEKQAHRKARDAKRWMTPEYKAAQRARQTTPEYRAKERARRGKQKERGFNRHKYRFGYRPKPEDGRCENCFKPVGRNRLQCDHDHDTGAFRGWLCSNCNTGIGRLGDTAESIRKVLAYLAPSRAGALAP